MPMGATDRQGYTEIGLLIDNFNRPNTASGGPGSNALGSTDFGNVPWKIVRSDWDITSGRARPVDLNAFSIAVVEARYSNFDMAVNISTIGGDGLYFRLVDAFNWWRLVMVGESGGQTNVRLQSYTNQVLTEHVRIDGISPITELRMRATEDYYFIYVNGILRQTFRDLSARHIHAVQHGIGRLGGSPRQGSAFDQFTLSPIHT